MEEIETKIYEEMKQAIADKTSCMIDSYEKVLYTTAVMFRKISNEISVDEVAKRADMFWNIALQRIDKEHAEVEKKKDKAREVMQRSRNQQPMPRTVPPIQVDPNAPESPCAKRARESAEKIKSLEDQIKDSSQK